MTVCVWWWGTLMHVYMLQAHGMVMCHQMVTWLRTLLCTCVLLYFVHCFVHCCVQFLLCTWLCTLVLLFFAHCFVHLFCSAALLSRTQARGAGWWLPSSACCCSTWKGRRWWSFLWLYYIPVLYIDMYIGVSITVTVQHVEGQKVKGESASATRGRHWHPLSSIPQSHAHAAF